MERPSRVPSLYLPRKGCLAFHRGRRVCFAGKRCPFYSVTSCGFLSLHNGHDATVETVALRSRARERAPFSEDGARTKGTSTCIHNEKGRARPILQRAACRKVAINYAAGELAAIQQTRV